MDLNNVIDILGFRDIGNPISITPYNTIIKNIDLYEGEINEDIIQMPVLLNKNNYILMMLNNLNIINNLNNNLNFFIKILPDGKNTKIYPNKIIFNEEQELSLIDIKYIDYKGRMINFGNHDHSFILMFE